MIRLVAGTTDSAHNTPIHHPDQSCCTTPPAKPVSVWVAHPFFYRPSTHIHYSIVREKNLDANARHANTASSTKYNFFIRLTACLYRPAWSIAEIGTLLLKVF